MLQAELCRHSSIQHVEYTPHTHFETHHWLKAAVLLRRPGALYSKNEPYRGYGSVGNARAYMIDTVSKNVPGFEVPKEDEALVYEGWNALCRRYAQPVFFEKSPQVVAEWAALSLLIDWALETEFSVKVIGLVRNPLAVQYSAENLFSTDPEHRQFGWLASHRNLVLAREMLGPDRFRLVRYEDIVTDPAGTLSDLFDFIGVSDEGLGEREIRRGSVDKWRLDRSYTLQLDRSVAQIAELLGYSQEDLLNENRPESGKAAPHRTVSKRILRLKLNWLRDRFLRPIGMRLRSLATARR